MQTLARGRVHVEFIDRAPDGFEQMRPGLQSFRGHAAAAGLRLARRPAIEQSDAHAATREAFRGKRSGRTGAND